MVLEEFNASLALNIGRSMEEERYRKKDTGRKKPFKVWAGKRRLATENQLGRA
jgi:hypothetical protein